MNNPKLLTIDEALSLSAGDVLNLNKQHLNQSLIQLMSIAGFTKQMVKAKGTKLWDSEGKEYTDFLGGFGSLNIGHNHPHIFESLEKVKTMPNFLQTCPGTLSAVLAHNLSVITPGNLQRSFFCNSGAEAVEAALKLSRIATGRTAVLTAINSFHGKTYGALSATGREKYRTNFKPLVPEISYFPFNDPDSLEKEVKRLNPACIVLEPVQGEGGIIVPESGYLKKVREICDQYGVLLVMDEIQTGLGRTGKMFACEYEDITPDILCIAKSLSGGVMPIGCIVTSHEIWQKGYGSMEKASLHTSTFGGSTFACAAGIATLEVLQNENLCQNSLEKGNYMIQELNRVKEKYDLIKDIRGKGLLIGIEFTEPKGVLNALTAGMLKKLAHEYLGAMVAGKLLNEHGILTAYTLNNPNVIRVEPPLTITTEEIDAFIAALDKVLSEHSGFFSLAYSTGKSFFSGKD